MEELVLFNFKIPRKSSEIESQNTPFFAFNHWINSFIFSASTLQWFHDIFGAKGAHYAATYARDLMLGSLVYYVVAGVWHLWIYNIKGDVFFPKGSAYKAPGRAIIIDQIQLAQASLFMYAGLPVFSEWLIEEGYTKVYWSADEVGGLAHYFALTALYLACVEVGVYWMHRTLHTNKFLYKHVHGLHHKYNMGTGRELSPWASIAFNPLDGLLQASPYVACLFLVPCHYLTHVFMLFFTAVWATNIHDALNVNSEPIMGSKYHTIHHTHYHYNYGQFFIFCDWFWGTLKENTQRPTEKGDLGEGIKAAKAH